ncbi:MAG TPA: heme o synthase [Thermoleophilia bacterium]|nr:heme o synthase [Thermoleophilia bacterium]
MVRHWRWALDRTGAAATASAYLRAAKPRVVALFLLATLAALLAGGGATPARTVALLAGVALGVGGAALLNNVLERDLDRRMERTRGRPTATGVIGPGQGAAGGGALVIAGIATAWAAGGALSAHCVLAGAACYVLVYTLLLKPRTAFSAVPGGLAGVFPPLAGWAASGAPWTMEIVLICAVVALWSPPHFWALALARHEDYVRAAVPTPVTRLGVRRASRQIAVWTVLLVYLTLVPAVAGLYGPGYAIVTLLAGGAFAALAVHLAVTRRHRSATLLYKLSGPYLAVVLAAMALAS